MKNTEDMLMVSYPSSLKMKKGVQSVCLRFFGGVVWWRGWQGGEERQAKVKLTLLSEIFRLRKNCKHLGKICTKPCKMQI